jgi:tetratricopeptide (TPR) repeat protein
MLNSGILLVPALLRLTVLCLTAVALTVSSSAADLNTARDAFSAGRYDQAAAMASEEVDRGVWNERWPRLLIQCQLATGRYDDAVQTYEAAIKRYPTSLTLRTLGIRAYRQSGNPDDAFEAEQQFMRLLQSSPNRYASRDNLVALGRFFARSGEDARKVLELFYDKVIDVDPNFLDAYLATAELAIDKGDFAVAAETLAKADKIDPADPDIASLAARAWANSDREKANEFLIEALRRNPNHADSLIAKAEMEIDAESYIDARATIRKVLTTNLHEPRAWSLLAVLAHLQGHYEIESLMRSAALTPYRNNPEVDHLIGRKLSDKYRFAEGADYQRRAIEVDARYNAATFQLAQDLLRLGQDEVGWLLAKEVADEDPYNVVAHNLMTLNDRVGGFTRIESDGIEVRMDPREAMIYGDDVMNLLREAKTVLCEKYQIAPEKTIIVEIFPDQSDFAIRTFGLPGGEGFLGVCFGRVITANSPASQGERPSNWQSVLWHEFCHVVTLEKTRNRMPRWLSEGISVYEERQRDPAWGESMSPRYREMILGDDLTPVSELSGAFLRPKSPLHLQFAYYESSLVVEFLIQTHGLPVLIATLDDLAAGLGINDALIRNVGSIEKLDAQFRDYAIGLAESFAPDAQWDRDAIPEQPSPDELVAWCKQNPTNYWALSSLATMQVQAKQFAEARKTLETIRDLGAMTAQRSGPMEQLALVYQQLGERDLEMETRRKIVAESSDALPSLDRLIEMASDDEDFYRMLRYAEQYLAVQPLTATGHEAVATASEQLDAPQRTVNAIEVLKLLDPVDPAKLDYRLASALVKSHRNLEAKRAVLRSLEEAPRYRDALRLLLSLQRDLEP